MAKDLVAKKLRHVSDKFAEDPLRVLRAMQFIARFKLQCEKATLELCRSLSSEHLPRERVGAEWEKLLLQGEEPSRGLRFLRDCGWIDDYPELKALIDCPQDPVWHPEGDVYVHTRIALSLLDSPPLHLALAVLLHDIAKPPTQTWDDEVKRFRFNGHDRVGAKMAEEILRRLRYPNQTIEEVSFMVSRHMKFMHVQEMRTAKLKRFMAANSFPMEIELHRVDCDSSNGFRDNYDFLHLKQEEFANEPLIPTPLLTGKDLIDKFCLSPGPKIG